jgi:hypothetical protein
MNIIQNPVFYLNHNVSVADSCLSLQLDPSDRANICLRKTEISSIYWSQLIRLHLKTEAESCLRNVVI